MSIDALHLTKAQSESQKADYFLDHRKIICELKALYSDSSSKVEKILSAYRERPEFPLFFGKWELEKILKAFPDNEKDEINKKIFTAVTDTVEGIVEKANRQIRSTKASFGMNDALGLLIIFNDNVEIYTPDTVARRVRLALGKRMQNGDKRFDQIAAVLIINTAHYFQSSPDLKLLPIVTIVDEQNPIADYVKLLLKKWAEFDGQPLLEGNGIEFLKQANKTFAQDLRTPKAADLIPRQESWRRRYLANPYLRTCERADLLRFGASAMKNIARNMIKGVPKRPFEEVANYLVQWTHFLEEMDFQGIDFRELHPFLENLREEMDELFNRYNP